ncbi:MAG: hypothetical protein NVSMB5_22780 [Candidatus Velthaea sp.]
MSKDSESYNISRGTDETIESIAQLEANAEIDVSLHQRWIERAAIAIGRPRTAYGVVAGTAGWIIINLLLARSGRAFDPYPFSLLSGMLSFSALLMTVFILTRENRTSSHDLQRDRLDLQINLLTERKISKVIEMLEALRRDSPNVPNRADPEAREMREATDPHAVVRALDERTPNRPDLPG